MTAKIRLITVLITLSLILALVGLLPKVQAATPTGTAPASALLAPSAQSPQPLQPVVAYAVKHDVSPALRTLKSNPAESAGQLHELGTLSLRESKGALAAPLMPDVDAAVQNWQGPTSMPAPIMSFEGISNTYGVAPPDTQGDIGYDPATNKKYYVQWVNLGYAVWDVTGATPVRVLGPLNGNTIWTGFGGACESTNDGDPITLYDPFSHRWMMSQFALPNYPSGPFWQCIAVSTSGDPTGAWYRYVFEWKDGTIQLMNDYPKFGVWPDGYYMTANQFYGSTGCVSSWCGTGVAAFERNQMLVGGAARMVYFNLGAADWGGMLPADFDGLTPPAAGTPNYFAEVHADEWANTPPFTQDEVAVYAFHADWATPANSTFTQVAVLPMTPFDGDLCTSSSTGRDCVPQPGTTSRLDAIGDRTMYRLAYRNFGGYESLVSNLTVDVDSTDRASVRWFEIRKTGSTWTLHQDGTYAPDSNHRWMGSIAQDHAGNMALGYSVSSSTVYPSIRYAGRLATDPLGTLPQAEVELHAGTVAQSGTNRWGDYSMMSVDPVDDCTFWYTQEYSNGSWDWRTWIGSFKFPGCMLEAQGALAGTVTSTSGGAPIAGAQVQAVRSITQTYGTATGGNGAYAIALPEATYTVGFAAYGYAPASVSSVSIVSGTTTTVNIALTPTSSYIVQGTVTDAQTGWPLYAHIIVHGDPFNPPAPNDDVWTDPVTGHYSVTLAANVTYTLNATAWVNGYLPGSQVVAPLTGNQTVNIGLNADQVACTAPGRTLNVANLYTEGFDSATPPALPAGWAETVIVTGTNTAPTWDTRINTRYPSGGVPHSAPNLVFFNSYSASSGAQNRLYQTSGLDLSAASGAEVSFWMYHDTGYTTSADNAQVQVSINGGSVWNNVGTAVNRYDGSTGWKQHTVNISAYAGQSDVRLALLGQSAYGNDVHLDDVTVNRLACQLQAGGLVVGNVYDNNTSVPLLGAAVHNDSGQSAVTQPTVDPTVDEGFYTIFSAAGTHAFTATQMGGYVPDAHNVTVVQSSTISSNFHLGAGRLTVAPVGASATVTSGLSTVVPVTLTNSGSASANFELVEVNVPYVPPVFGPFAGHGRHLGPKNLGVTSLAGVAYYLNPPTDVPELAAGDVIISWTTGLPGAWGVGFNTLANDLWVGNPQATGGDSRDYRFTRSGVNTGETINTAPAGSAFVADMAYNVLTNKLWQVNVSTDSCIYELDPVTHTPTGRSLCPAFGTSERGLAYDPTTNTFYAGSWNDSVINHFDANGTLLDSANVSLAISGLAYNPKTGHLFVAINASSGFDIYVLDAKNNYTNLGGFNVAGLGSYEQAGLEMSCDGHLWAVNQTTKQVLEIDSGETGACDWMGIPWLSEAPITGTVPAGNNQPVNLTFDANSLQPGVYNAQVRILNDTPYGMGVLPVTLTVNSAPTFGMIAGTVTGLGRCDANPAPLNNAKVVVLGSTGYTTTLTTNASGQYQWSLDAANSPLTLTVSSAGHVTQTVTGVAITAQMTTTQNFNLRSIQPCVTVAPQALSVMVQQGQSLTRSLTLNNGGAGTSPFALTELPAGAGRILQSAADAVPDARHAPTQVGRTAPVRLAAPDATLITEGFEGGAVPPTGWTEVISDTNWNWELGTASPHSGSGYADIQYDDALLNQSEWLLSPELSLSSGTLSFWSFGSVYWCKTTYDNCDLNVWIVVGNVGGGDDIYVGKGDTAWTANWTWAQSTFNLTPLLPGGPVRIGFQYIGRDGAEVALDDILFDGEEGFDIPWLAEQPVTGTLSADSARPVEVTFTAAPTMTAGIYRALLRVQTNDLTSPVVNVPVTMTVILTPAQLTINKVGNGTVTPIPAPPYGVGDVVTLTATPDPGWLFSGWSGDLSGTTSPVTITLTGDKVVTATFTLACAPVAGVDFTYAPPAPKVGQLVTFNGSALTGTTPITYSWNFGDSATGNGSPITHAFPLTVTMRSYTVTLTATNACGTAPAVVKALTVWPQTVLLPVVLK